MRRYMYGEFALNSSIGYQMSKKPMDASQVQTFRKDKSKILKFSKQQGGKDKSCKQQRGKVKIK